MPHCWDFLKKFKTIIVFGDFENGHITLLDELAQRFEGAVKHVKHEDYKGCKDANEILQQYGKEALVTAVQGAVPVAHPKIISLSDVEMVDISKLERFSSGLPSLDRILGGFYPGQLITVTGERGDGKSTLASQFGTFALMAGYSLFMYSGELPNWLVREWFDRQIVGDEHVNKIISEAGHVDYRTDAAIMPRVDAWYRDKVYLYDNSAIENGDTEEEKLPELMEIAIKQYGCRVLIVDNLMTAMEDEIEHDLYRQQTVFIKNMARMSKRYNVVIFVIVHPRKRQGDIPFGSDDIAGSSNITNISDVVIRYSKPVDDRDTDIKERILTILKNRLTGDTDRDGISLCFQDSSKRISENPECFDWSLGWEDQNNQMGSDVISDTRALPF